jgi:hypothetical protein
VGKCAAKSVVLEKAGLPNVEGMLGFDGGGLYAGHTARMGRFCAKGDRHEERKDDKDTLPQLAAPDWGGALLW